MKKFFFLGFAFCVFHFAFLFAVIGEPFEEGVKKPIPADVSPWFTGPIITPSAYVVPYGFVNLEPYIYTTITKSAYDHHWKSHRVPTFVSINPLLVAQIGVSKRVQFSFTPQFYYNKTKGKESIRFGDLPLQFAFQCYFDTPDTSWPAVKFFIQETCPTGNYQKLDPKKFKTDATGQGSFATFTGFTFGKKYHFGGWHWLNTRLQLGTTYSAPVHVRSFNAYGGGEGTVGKVYPGTQFSALLGLEYCLTRNWVLALDIDQQYSRKDRFKGKSHSKVGDPLSEQLSLAPAIEYNFNAKYGLLGGAWFTVLGRNSSDFLSYVIAFNYYN